MLADWEYQYSETVDKIPQAFTEWITCSAEDTELINDFPKIATGNRRIELANFRFRDKREPGTIYVNGTLLTKNPGPGEYWGTSTDNYVDWYKLSDITNNINSTDELPEGINPDRRYHTDERVNTLIASALTGRYTNQQIDNMVTTITQVLDSIIGTDAGDADTIVNTWKEMLTVFQTFQEGVNLATQLNTILNTIGNLSSILTVDKSSIVAAINELVGRLSNITDTAVTAITYENNILTLKQNGKPDLTATINAGNTYSGSNTVDTTNNTLSVKDNSITNDKLAEDNKTGLLSSINAVVTGANRLSFAAVINWILGVLGNPVSLTTTAKNYTDAINEVNAKSVSTPINPSGVSFTTAPGTPTITNSNITETVSVVDDNGTTVNIPSQVLGFTLAATGKKRLDAIIVKYTSPVGYEIITGTEVDSNQTATTPSIPVNRLFVRYLTVSDGAVTSVNTGGGHTQNTDTGTNSRTFEVGTGTAGTESTFKAVGTASDVSAVVESKGAAKSKLKGASYVVANSKILILNTLSEIIAQYDIAEEFTAVPATLTSPGIPGQKAWDSSGILFYCVAVNFWIKLLAENSALGYTTMYVAVPPSLTSPGVQGQRAYDPTNKLMYECVSDNTWVKYSVSNS